MIMRPGPATPSRRLFTGMSVALLLALGACGRDTGQRMAEPRGAALQSFYDQKPGFGSCAGYATTTSDEKLFAGGTFECARLQVPLDYADPEGRKIQIAMLRVPARGERIGSLLLNSGGPGGPGMSMAATMATTLASSPVTDRFDLVGFDPRGVAASTPAIRCFTDEEYERGDTVLSTASIGTTRWTEADTRRVVGRCAKGSGGTRVLAHVGSRDVVKDMDVLRAVLGDEKLNFLGQSYGTRLGALYAEAYPQNVRAMVLDGAIDPTLGTVPRRITQFTGFQQAFDKMATACATSKDCPLGTDPATATSTFQKIVRPLLAHPVPAGGGRKLTFDDAVGGVISGLYLSEVWPAITKGIAELRSGRGDTLLKIGDAFGGHTTDGRRGNFTEAVFAINCMDEQRQTPDQAVDLKRRIYEAAPFTDPGLGAAGARDGCEHWPVKPTLTYPYATRVTGLPQTLTISITGDPSTPYEGGVSLAKALHGTLLPVRGEQHTIAMLGTNPCVNKIVADYLTDLRTPPENTTCTL